MFDRENDAKPVESRAFATESHGGQLILTKGCKVEICGEKSNSIYKILENLEKNIVHRSTIHESEILRILFEYFRKLFLKVSLRTRPSISLGVDGLSPKRPPAKLRRRCGENDKG